MLQSLKRLAADIRLFLSNVLGWTMNALKRYGCYVLWMVAILMVPSRTNAAAIVFSTQITKESPRYERTYQILREAFRRLGHSFQLVPYPAKRALEMANEGITDGEARRVPGINKDEWTNLIQVPEVLQYVNIYAYSTKRIALPDGWKDLRGHVVAVRRGHVRFSRMASRYAKRVHEPNTYESQLNFLLSNRADIIIGSVAIDSLLTTEKFRNKGIRKIEPPLMSTSVYPYLHIKHENLVGPLAKAMRAMKRDGTWAEIEKRTPETPGR